MLTGRMPASSDSARPRPTTALESATLPPSNPPPPGRDKQCPAALPSRGTSVREARIGGCERRPWLGPGEPVAGPHGPRSELQSRDPGAGKPPGSLPDRSRRQDRPPSPRSPPRLTEARSWRPARCSNKAATRARCQPPRLIRPFGSKSTKVPSGRSRICAHAPTLAPRRQGVTDRTLSAVMGLSHQSALYRGLVQCHLTSVDLQTGLPASSRGHSLPTVLPRSIYGVLGTIVILCLKSRFRHLDPIRLSGVIYGV
jgi:hypothetical protein